MRLIHIPRIICISEGSRSSSKTTWRVVRDGWGTPKAKLQVVGRQQEERELIDQDWTEDQEPLNAA